jgi:UDP-N-acetylmuramyl pentapeptide phosphotransferase/UDP-N-acetylglucosamine-1-phosphate transferase
MIIELIVLAIILFLIEYFFIQLAPKLNFFDLPNERSSHVKPTIRGGGIIFIFAALIFFIYNQYEFPYLVLALTLVGFISFLDDIKSVSNKIRFAFHLISMLLVFYQLDLFNSLSPVYLLLSLVVFIGIMNAYNFMDGINGITALYSLSVLVPLCITETNDSIKTIELYTIIAVLIFSFFNVRRTALVFAGDVGSISISLLIVFFIISRIQQTFDFTLIGLLLVYGIDTIYTLMHRIYHKENIFKAHRKHLYQFLTNEGRYAQLNISLLYTFIQLGINFFIVNQLLNIYQFLLILIVLSIIYWKIKFRFLSKANL